jgi:hypothetical protein
MPEGAQSYRHAVLLVLLNGLDHAHHTRQEPAFLHGQLTHLLRVVKGCPHDWDVEPPVPYVALADVLPCHLLLPRSSHCRCLHQAQGADRAAVPKAQQAAQGRGGGREGEADR